MVLVRIQFDPFSMRLALLSFDWLHVTHGLQYQTYAKRLDLISFLLTNLILVVMSYQIRILNLHKQNSVGLMAGLMSFCRLGSV